MYQRGDSGGSVSGGGSILVGMCVFLPGQRYIPIRRGIAGMKAEPSWRRQATLPIW